ncbi:glycosyltransferase [Rhodococcus sp. TAF43]|uniref:glycosyltransferase n=1 Tax=Rhodococcus sp. TAF43 TaxID=3237483 RepID=UPI003F9A403E
MSGTRRLRVLFAPETFNLGETSRAVEVAKEIRAGGHDVLFMGYSRRFAGYVREAGLALELLDPELSEREAEQLIAVDQGRALRHPFTDSMVRTRVASELALIERWRPDCIVIGTTLTLFISARAARVPLVYVRPYAMSHGHLTRMTMFPLTAGQGAVAADVNRAAAWFLRQAATKARWKPGSFRRVAAEHAVHLPERTLAALDADLNLIASLFPFADQRPLAAREIAVGPLFAQSAGELPHRVASLAERKRPAVYIGMGSSAGRRLVLEVLKQLSRMDIDIVSSAGRYVTEDDCAALPENVQVYDFLPAHLLAGMIDASIIHGGEGTVQTACASGAPFAGIGLQSEQRINLDECARYGNALRFTPRDIRRGRLPHIVERLLHDESLRHAARTVQPLAQPVGAVNSAAAILDLARRGMHESH